MKKRYIAVAVVFVFAFFSSRYWLTNAVAADASSSASVAGVVKFDGIPPKPSKIDMAFDPNCKSTSPAVTEDIVAGANGSLENVVVFVADGLGDRTFQPPAQPVVLEQKGCLYRPHVVALQTNQKLSVVNSDATTHNIHPSPANNRESNTIQPPGVPLELSFAREEIAIPVKCNVHPWMRGYIAVFKHPYFAVTGKDGSFELKDLPPGTYTITAWHGKLGTQSQKVTVSAGQAQKLEFVFKQ
jgi:Carboxypeptidase regulatory-like domain